MLSRCYLHSNPVPFLRYTNVASVSISPLVFQDAYSPTIGSSSQCASLLRWTRRPFNQKHRHISTSSVRMARHGFRHPSTSQPEASSDAPSQSAHDASPSPSSSWESVFSGIQSMPPLLPTSAPGVRRARRQTMTARELSAFEDMFNMIFDAVSEQQARTGDTSIANASAESASVGIGSGGPDDIFGKLRIHSKRMKMTSMEAQELDRKKEAMELCATDQELLDWAMREVFGESERYDSECRKAMAESIATGSTKELPMLQPPTYPHLIALLMSTFRDKYGDPHLALSMFDHARHLSTASYVFGCSTDAYNELIKTRWMCFQDYRGVCDALEEMDVNGVEANNGTVALVDMVRKEIGERNVWVEDEMANGELSAAQRIISPGGFSKGGFNDWKQQAIKDYEDEDGFDRWDEQSSRPHGRNASRFTQPRHSDGAAFS
ncbi:hypothetical protein FISHEDRAFT_64985 [Fistulina hepatica ATCC 64428]|uniref:Mtf2-like C-terminal domain-containing protein n=1 Tax=Fistulina hepatica ATCC 64428 TaxID=1128425 RepID=A0A0D7AHR7_9AGAR|nr:hypothetical protein FISHEDRAFT_64985 [Fistulina hepatica ATCC 64428]